MVSFNLLTEPWIPCLLCDDSHKQFGIAELIEKAADIVEIAHPSPLATIALHRPLLAILYQTQSVGSNAGWTRLWRGGWDSGALDQYLTEWKDHFDLFSDLRPFYQRPDLPVDEESAAPISKLAPELAAGNNKQLFDHSSDDAPRAISPADAACLLVSIQNWGLGGGKSGGGRSNFLHAPLVGGAATLLKGDNLRETLLLNLVPKSALEDPPRAFAVGSISDQCAWEGPLPEMVKERDPRGIADYLTWQARYIRLLPDESGKVSCCSYCQGEGISTMRTLIDPFHAFRKSKEGKLQTVAVRRDRATWRDASSLLSAFGADDGKPAVAVATYAQNVHNYQFDKRLRIPVLVAGMANDKAAILRWTGDLYAVPRKLLTAPDSLATLEVEMEVAREVESFITNALFVYAAHFLFGDKAAEDPGFKGLSKNESKDCRNLRDRIAMIDQFWSDLEPAFHSFMANDFPDNGNWRQRVRAAAYRCFNASIATAGSDPRILRAQVVANATFFRRLNDKIPPMERRSTNAA